MSTSKLGLYNGALRLLGEGSLASLTEDSEPRRVLDDVYDDGIIYCLEAGLWNFAMRAVAIDADPGVDPAFGYSAAFVLPDDWVRTDAVALAENFNPPLTEYVQEQGYWYANGDPLYVRYVSKDVAYGLDLSLWPMTFARYVETHLAGQICHRLTDNQNKLERILRLEIRRKTDASTKDVMNEAARFKPTGSWVRSRGGSTFGINSRR